MFCNKCGASIDEGSLFCSTCGTKLTEEAINRKSHKCPNCGEPSKSFESKCSLCGFEFRNISSNSCVSSFRQQLEQIRKSPKKSEYKYFRADDRSEEDVRQREKNLIENYPIPNTKEDILEFMILACSNFDSYYYLTHLNEEDLSDAWLAKIKQCYQKAKLVFGCDPEFELVERIYEETLGKIGQKGKECRTDKPAKKKTKIILICIAIVIAIIVLLNIQIS